MINVIGHIDIDNEFPALLDIAESIKLENYKVNTPTKFRKHANLDIGNFTETLKEFLKADSVDWVLFSAAEGAEEHTDDLDPEKYGELTYLIPLILPEGRTTLFADGEFMDVANFIVYEINHQKPHSVTVPDTTGCVFIMASKL